MPPQDERLAGRGPRPSADGHGAAHFASAHPPPSKDASPEAYLISRLEWLDDLMFAAIDGDPVALDGATSAWQRTVEELGAPAVEESRRQYLRHAQSVWNDLRNQPNYPPHKVFAAIEVISLLADRAW